MICYICQRELKNKDLIRGVQKCDTLGCKNMVGIGYRACRGCSEKYNECEVCRANIGATECKR